MMNPKRFFVPLVTVAALAVSPAQAAPASQQSAKRCFLYSQIANWKPDGPKTIYLRTSVGRYYRLDLAGRCPSITHPGAFLITKIRGPSLICSAIDWDIHVMQSWDDIPSVCLVKEMTEVPKSEINALPMKSRP